MSRRSFKQTRRSFAQVAELFPRSCHYFVLVSLLLLLLPAFSAAQVKRVVIVKCDGLPYDVVDRFVQERDPRTGKSQLPWIDHIFYQRGTRLANFYVRGLSLSAPSWSLLDTGQHLQIKGNVEFDRYTLHAYDYLNFIPFIVTGVAGTRVDMPGVEVLDSLGVPLLVDAFPHDERFVAFSLYQRGPRFLEFPKSLQNKLKRTPRELFDEWTMGFEMRDAVSDQLVKELIANLNNSRLRYLDLVLTAFDHLAHHNNDRESHLAVLKQLDFTLGEIWTAIQKTPLAQDTALIVVSDHGLNTDERVYSQGYNLVKLLAGAAGGGHHVVTKRRLLLDYSLKGINPFAQLVTTTSPDSYYLRGQSTDYPTAVLDFDGNERASIHLRDSDLNLLQILLQQLQNNHLSAPLRDALTNAFFSTLDGRREVWQNTLAALNEELGALRRSIEQQRKLWGAQPKHFTSEEQKVGRDDESKRVFAQLDRWVRQEHDYSEYAGTLANLLALRKSNFTPARLKIEDLIVRRAMGESNSIYQLQNYIVGVAPEGLVLNADGSLDMQKSFLRLDYSSLLHNLTVRNNVQPGVSNRPVDIIATRIAADLVLPHLAERPISTDVIWAYDGPERQALILARADEQGRLSLRYQPIKNLKQDSNGQLHFEIAKWQPGLPLRIFEDPQLSLPAESRAAWLSEWHTDLEWLRVLHKTQYSNGLIGLYEELARHPVEHASDDEAGISADDRLLRRFAGRQRKLIETDMLLVANDHWNFDVRGFNPGGNHGSFLRISTHSTLMIAGGEKTNVPRGAVVEEPYDSLSFVPTVLALTGNLRDDSSPIGILWDKGFRRFPGRIVSEILPPPPDHQRIAVSGVKASP